MCKRNISCLPLTHPQLGSWPKTQACALTGNQTDNLPSGLRDKARPIEPHQSGPYLFVNSFLKISFTCLTVHSLEVYNSVIF